jgi:hypothetical protein
MTDWMHFISRDKKRKIYLHPICGILGVVPELRQRACDAEEQNGGEIVCKRFSVVFGKRVLFPPVLKKRLVDASGSVHETTGGFVMKTNGIKRFKKIILRIDLGGKSRQSRNVCGRDPPFKLRGAFRIYHTVNCPDGEELSRSRPREMTFGNAVSVNCAGNSKTLGDGPEKSHVSRTDGWTMIETVHCSPGRPYFRRGTTFAAQIADELILHLALDTEGTVLFEIDPTIHFVTAN